MCSYPTLLLVLQKWQLGFWPFCIFLFIICLNYACMHLFLVPYSFFLSSFLISLFLHYLVWPCIPLHKNCGVLTTGPPGNSSLIVSFVFYCPRRLSSRCKHCSKGSQAPACLNSSSPDPITTIICLDIAMPSKTTNFSWQDSCLSWNCLYNVWTSSYHLFVLKNTYQVNVVCLVSLHLLLPPTIHSLYRRQMVT